MTWAKPITQLYGLHAGATALVLADGPTATAVRDIGVDVITIGTNRAALLGVRYWVLADWVVYLALRERVCARVGPPRCCVAAANICRAAQPYGQPMPDYEFVPLRDHTHGGATLMSGGGSGLMALHFAVRLGCRRIVLAGFDGGPVDGKWYLDGTAPSAMYSTVEQYASFRKMIEWYVAELAHQGIEVFNASARPIKGAVEWRDTCLV